MSTIEASERPDSSSLIESVEAEGARTSQAQAVLGVDPLARGREHTGMHGVGLEVEGQGHPLWSSVDEPPPQPAKEQGGRQEALATETVHTLRMFRNLEVEVQERGPAAYIAEFIGTFVLVFFITAAVSLYVTPPTAANPTPYIDFGVIGLVHVFVLFMLIQTLAVASGAHFNPAVTVAITALRQIRPAGRGDRHRRPVRRGVARRPAHRGDARGRGPRGR